jgi:PKD repeat protein
MKQHLLFCLFLFPIAIFAQKQTYNWTPAPHASSAALSAELDSWEVYAFDAAPLVRAAQEKPEGLAVTWQLAGKVVAFDLFADDIRGKNYRLLEAGPEGMRELPIGPNLTYGGRTPDGATVRLTLNDDFVYGYWQEAGKIWFVQPLRDFDPAAAAGLFVVYETGAVKPVPNARCGWTHTLDMLEKKEAEHDDRAKAAGQCYEVEIALASDFLMHQVFGSVAATQNFTLGVLNNVQTNYDNEFADELRFVVVANMVSSCSTCDPWTSSLVANTLLTSFRDWGNAGGFGVTYDVASLWTNRDFTGDVIGLAWLNAICVNNRYNVLQRFSSNAQTLRVLQAHELGHNFSAQHDAVGSPTIMAPSVNSSSSWSAASVSSINAYVVNRAQTGTCFSDCGVPAPPTALIQAPVTHVCPGSVVPFIDASTGNPFTWNWNFPGAIPGNSQQQHPTVRYNNAGSYPVQLAVANDVGFDTEILAFDILVDNNGQKFLLYETFETGMTWQTVNPDNSITWEVTPVGGTQYGTKAAFVNNFSYTGSGQVDGMISPPFSLQGVAGPVLKLDYAYRRRNTTSNDQLRIKVSTNGGASFPHTVFTGQENGSGNFATGTPLNAGFTPNSVSDWCYGPNPGPATCLEISLAQFMGQENVAILIENVHGTSGNNMYVDNVRVQVDCVPPAPPVAAIYAEPTVGCAPLSVTFFDVSDGIVTSRQWNFGGGNPASSTAESPTVLYTMPGQYSVSLEATNSAGSSLVVQPNFITVNTAPTADFSFTVNGSTVTFTNLTPGSGVSYTWNFGNGQSSFQTNPIHTYGQPGQYTVRLTAANECGQTIKERVITIVPTLVAGFSAAPLTGCAPITVQFSNSSVGNPGAYNWSFPGGSPATSTAANPTVIYNTPGLYDVRLIAVSGNFSDTLLIEDYVVAGGPPNAAFQTNYTPGPTSASFSNTSVNAQSVQWFANGETSDEDNPVFDFQTDGEYTIILVAYNTCGTDTTEQTLTIVTAPQAGFNLDAGAGCVPAEVAFENTSSANATSYQWSFPGGVPETSTLPNPTVTYAAPGAYEVTLITGNAAGADTLAQTMTIGTGPQAGFDFNTQLGQTEVAFSNTSVNAQSVQWFANGETSDEDNPVFDFQTDGEYTIILVAYNTCGTDTTEQTLTIVTAPQAGFNLDAGAGCVPAEVAFENTSSANATSYQWSFPGGMPETSTLPDPTVTYAAPGAYEVTLITGNAAGADTLAQTMTIGTGPQAGFDFNTQLGQTEVAFSNTSVNAQSVRWFANGETSDEDNPVFDFETDGEYTIILVAYNTCGTDTTEQTLTIVTAPQAGFNLDAGAGCVPAEVAFENTSSANATSYQWSFPGGVPETSTLPNPTVTYAAPGAYEVTLITGNAAGADTLAQTMTIGTGPQAGFDFNTQLGQTEVAFSNTSVNAQSVQWFANGETSDEDNPVFDFETDGEYTVILVAYNTCGTDTTEQTLTIVTAPQAGFNLDAGAGCVPAEVAFENTSSANATSYQWSFPGGVPETSTLPNPTVTYAAPGTYEVMLITGNAAGTSMMMQTVSIGTGPQAGFDFNTQLGQTEVAFSNTSVNAQSVQWFANGETSDEDNPVFDFETDGEYTVILVAYNTCGTDTTEQTLTIVTAPQAGFNLDAGAGCVPAEVAFENTSSANATSYQWSFPGGVPETSTLPNPTVTYAAPGAYEVMLITGNAAGTSMLTQTLTVITAPQAASFDFAVNGTTVQFSGDAAGATEYRWDFGDGADSPSQNPEHTYGADGDYIVTFTASNACGSITTIDTVTISNALPAVNFSAVLRRGCAPFEVQFINQSSDNAQSFLWLMPGAEPATSTEADPVAVYNQPGVYSVTLTATNAAGAASIARMDFIEILAQPEAAFEFSIDDLTVAFTNTSTHGDSYRWDFGDGSPMSGEENPVHTYAGSGTYAVTLEVTNECGSVVFTQEVNVIINSAGEVAGGSIFRVYPNPANNLIVLEGAFGAASGPGDGSGAIEIFDAIGRRVLQMPLQVLNSQVRQEIAIAHLPAGAYFYEVKWSAAVAPVAGKLVIVR